MKKGATDPEHARFDGLAQVRSYVAATECSRTYCVRIFCWMGAYFLASVPGTIGNEALCQGVKSL